MQKQNKKKEPEWPSFVFGMIFIAAVLFVIVYLVMNASPEKPWVCDTAGRSASLTRFGSCHK